MSVRDTPVRRPGARRHGRPMARPARDGVRIAPLAVCLAVVALAAVDVAFGGGAGRGSVAAFGIPATSPAVTSTARPAEVAGRAAGPIGVADDGAPAGDEPVPTTGDTAIATPPPTTAKDPAGPPPCHFDNRPAPHAALKDWATTIVDTAYTLPDGYRPPDLVPVARAGIGGWGLVRSFVIDDLRALADAAADAGNPLAVQSAFRSRSRQAEVYAGWVTNSGEAMARRFSARPGHSEHELGTALDLRATSGGAPWTGAFGSTAAGRWLAEHATEYGFVLSYPAGAESVTCYGAEAWHVRYVGREMAARVAASGLPLRAWLFANALEH